MADMKATVTANVDCTALIQADLAALLFELVGDLRERCKRLENTNAAIDGMHSEAVQKRDQLRQELDDCHVEISVRSLERQELQRELADAKVQVVNERNEFQQQLAQVTAERDELRAQLDKLRAQPTEVRAQVAELTKKASDLGVQQLTPRQVEISDSTGTDGEGQSK